MTKLVELADFLALTFFPVATTSIWKPSVCSFWQQEEDDQGQLSSLNPTFLAQVLVVKYSVELNPRPNEFSRKWEGVRKSSWNCPSYA